MTDDQKTPGRLDAEKQFADRVGEILARKDVVLCIGIDPDEATSNGGFTSSSASIGLTNGYALMIMSALAEAVMESPGGCPCPSCEEAINRARLVLAVIHSTSVAVQQVTERAFERVVRRMETAQGLDQDQDQNYPHGKLH